MTRVDPEPRRSMAPSKAGEEHVVLYDQACPVCRSAIGRLRDMDRDHRLRFVPAHDPEVSVRFPWISESSLRESLHLVGPGGATWAGAQAIEQILGVLPGWRWASVLLGLPLIRSVARKVYGWVARRRYRLSCALHCGDGGAGLNASEEPGSGRL